VGKPLKTLVIEDSEGDALLLLRLLRNGGYDTVSRRVDNARDLAAALAEGKWDIAFSDHSMPQFSSFEALAMVKASQPDMPFIIVSGSIGEEVAVAAMKAGAQDYLMKSNLVRLVSAVDRELKDADDRQARRQAEHSLLAQKEALRIAREIQDRLLPIAAPIIPGFDVAGASIPAEATGGDYYDFIPGPRNEMFVVIGDVTGHGLGPALLMADVRAYLRALAVEHDSIPDLLDRANRLLREDLGSFRFITLLLAALFPATRTLRYLNAGHPSGFVLDGDGLIKAQLPASVPALGLAPDTSFPEAMQLTLAPSDMLVLLTDGALEATSSADEEFGIIRVLDIVRRERHRPAAEIIAAVFDAVRLFTEGSGLQDDLTAVIVKASPETGDPS
jgi:serine phosphatase RsbU (regulator of sigma subunit)